MKQIRGKIWLNVLNLTGLSIKQFSSNSKLSQTFRIDDIYH